MKNEGELIITAIVELLICKAAYDVKSLLVWILANALLLMFCYYQDRQEHQERREKKRVRRFADGRASAYENKEVIK